MKNPINLKITVLEIFCILLGFQLELSLHASNTLLDSVLKMCNTFVRHQKALTVMY